MKNLKNTITACALTAVLAFGSVSANAGLIVSDKSGSTQPCGTVKNDLFTQLSGILIVGAPLLNGLLVSDRAGLLVSDRSGLMVSDKANGCKSGLLVSDRDGLMVSDRSGLIVSD